MRVARAANFTNGTDVPPAVGTNMAKVMAFEARFVVTRMVTGEWGVDRFTVDSPSGINFVTKFGALKGKFDLGGDGGRGRGREWLGVGRRSQFFDVSF